MSDPEKLREAIVTWLEGDVDSDWTVQGDIAALFKIIDAAGFAIVPKEPTEAMVTAGNRRVTTTGTWNGMLEAAPRLT